MSRIPHAKRDELSPEHQQIWDHIHAVRSGGGGPYSMLLHVPALALRAESSLTGFTPREKLLADIPLSLMREHGLSDELFARAERELSRRQLVEVIALVGHYSTIGFVANTFGIKAPEGSQTF